MKYLFSIVFSVFFILTTIAQNQSQFEAVEVRDMIALSNSFTQIEIYNTDLALRPKSYSKVYTSGIYGLDNCFQIWIKGKTAVIVFRGSTSKKISWLENIYSVMIPAKGIIILPGEDTVVYQFAKHDSARVHAGWSLGLVFMIQDIINQIQLLNYKGIYRIIITGHSQGGALAQLCRAYLENIPKDIISDKCQFKTFVFASPMIGNKYFVNEYALYRDNISVYNPKDLVPKMPITVKNKKGDLISWKNIEKLLDSTSNVTIRSLALNTFANTVSKDPSKSYTKMAGDDVYKQIVGETGPIEMPSYCRDLNYVPMNNRLIIGPFEELHSQMSFVNNDKDTLSRETQIYRLHLEAVRGGKAYQHKPYNYYLYFLKNYFIKDFVQIIEEERYQWNRP